MFGYDYWCCFRLSLSIYLFVCLCLCLCLCLCFSICFVERFFSTFCFFFLWGTSTINQSIKIKLILIITKSTIYHLGVDWTYVYVQLRLTATGLMSKYDLHWHTMCILLLMLSLLGTSFPFSKGFSVQLARLLDHSFHVVWTIWPSIASSKWSL